MFDEILRKTNDLMNQGEAFALAVVVRREAPISGRTGDKAIILANGTIAGWIGGGCTQPIVIKEAQNAIKDGKARFVRVTPTSSKEHLEGILEYNMTCHSGGTIDVYIEPVLPKTHLVIFGKSPVAQTLAQLGRVLNYRVSVIAPDADKTIFPHVDSLSDSFDLHERLNSRQACVIVSTQGEEDERALQSALKIENIYLAFVASRKKAAAVFDFLRTQGVTETQLQGIKVPAGLDIKAHLPEEIAVSILAEIIQVRNSAAAMSAVEEKTEEIATDPVCGMSVEIKTAKHLSDFQGQTFYFCCAGCKQSFDQSPEKYLKRPQEPAAAVDPVCGMSVDVATAKHRSQLHGENYYFCCAGCKTRFDKQPEQYLSVTLNQKV